MSLMLVGCRLLIANLFFFFCAAVPLIGRSFTVKIWGKGQTVKLIYKQDQFLITMRNHWYPLMNYRFDHYWSFVHFNAHCQQPQLQLPLIHSLNLVFSAMQKGHACAHVFQNSAAGLLVFVNDLSNVPCIPAMAEDKASPWLYNSVKWAKHGQNLASLGPWYPSLPILKSVPVVRSNWTAELSPWDFHCAAYTGAGWCFPMFILTLQTMKGAVVRVLQAGPSLFEDRKSVV